MNAIPSLYARRAAPSRKDGASQPPFLEIYTFILTYITIFLSVGNRNDAYGKKTSTTGGKKIYLRAEFNIISI